MSQLARALAAFSSASSLNLNNGYLVVFMPRASACSRGVVLPGQYHLEFSLNSRVTRSAKCCVYHARYK